MALPLSSINFNSRSLGSIGMDVEFIRNSTPIEKSEDLAIQFNQTLKKKSFF